MKKLILLLYIIPFLFTTAAAQKMQELSIHFDNRFGNEQLLPEQTFYLRNDTLVVNRFKYYISHIELIATDGKIITPPNDYFLIDIADKKSTSIKLQVPVGNYNGIRFLLGVDSIRNVSGVQTGALDPLHGMFWTWNSGYIMAKLEGTASSSTIAGKQFTYHIGGFRKHQNTTRTIELKTSVFSTSLTITANAAAWFKDIDIAATPVCHSPGTLAIHIANNYSAMFSIRQ